MIFKYIDVFLNQFYATISFGVIENYYIDSILIFPENFHWIQKMAIFDGAFCGFVFLFLTGKYLNRLHKKDFSENAVRYLRCPKIFLFTPFCFNYTFLCSFIFIAGFSFKKKQTTKLD